MKKIVMTILGIMIIGGFIGTIYTFFFKKEQKQWYSTEHAQKRTIAQVIRSTGYLEAEDLLKIGSIVPGIINQLLVEENQQVKKGQLIAIIDDGRDDTEVRETEGQLKQAQHDLVYTTAHFARQKALFEVGQLAKDTFEKLTCELEDAKALVQTRQAQHDKAKLIFNNKKIKAPDDGIIIQKVSTEGETVTLASPATIIYTLAKDISKMKVQLEIDENRIGEVKVGQVATLMFDTYPYKKFTGVIKEISNAPIKKQTAVSYNASFIIDNKELLLRPGMTVNAQIIVDEKEHALSIPGHMLAINSVIVQEIAKTIGFAFKPLSKTEKRELEQKGVLKTVWLVVNKTFQERPVILGINDNAFFEVISGLNGTEDIISDLQEPDSMQQLYSKIFGKGL